MIKQWQESDDLQEAAAAGNAESQYRLGVNYLDGKGVVGSDKEAAKWFEKAASAGHADAQFMLGTLLAAGRGVQKSPDKALEWFHQSAEQGQPRAQFILGEAYMNGLGVTRDRAWAARWYGLSAEQGHQQSQFLLGALYSGGIGLPKSLSKALFWVKRAQLAGHPDADKALSTLKKRMPDKQFNTVLTKAERWRAKQGLKGYNNKPTVIYVQHILNRMNYPSGFPDGIRGPRTDEAIRRFLMDRKMDRMKNLDSVVKLLREESMANK